jgi:hypothetical protein
LEESFGLGFLDGSHDAILIDGLDGIGTDLQGDPTVFLRDVEFFLAEIDVEFPLRLIVCV